MDNTGTAELGKIVFLIFMLFLSLISIKFIRLQASKREEERNESLSLDESSDTLGQKRVLGFLYSIIIVFVIVLIDFLYSLFSN
jgi:uncharacterized membrane protein